MDHLRTNDAAESSQQDPAGNVEATVEKRKICPMQHHQDQGCRPPGPIKHGAANNNFAVKASLAARTRPGCRSIDLINNLDFVSSRSLSTC